MALVPENISNTQQAVPGAIVVWLWLPTVGFQVTPRLPGPATPRLGISPADVEASMRMGPDYQIEKGVPAGFRHFGNTSNVMDPSP